MDELTDQQIVLELARAAALSGNAHTRAYLLRNRGYWRRWPIRIWRFSDGYYVIAAKGEAESLVGKRVTRIAGRPVAELLAKVRPLYAGNDAWAGYMATYTLTSPDVLIGLGVLAGDGAARIETKGASAVMAPEPFTPRQGPEESWWFLSPKHPATKGWKTVLRDQGLPAHLTWPSDNYRLVRCTGDIAYLPFNRASAGSGETLAAFGKRIMSELEAAPPRRLVVDLRYNTGGDLSQGDPFIAALAASPIGQEPGRLIVVLGQNTFSAGISHATWLKQASKARFAGESPGDELDMWAEGGNVVLPRSGLTLHYADKAHRYSRKALDVPAEQLYLDWNIDNLAPDFPARVSFADYAAGRDPVTEQALGRPLRCPAA